MVAFIQSQSDFFVFLHGFVWIAFGAAALNIRIVPRHSSFLRLGQFGILLGVHEWMVMLTDGTSTPLFGWIQPALLILSFVALLEFARSVRWPHVGSAPVLKFYGVLVGVASLGTLGGQFLLDAGIRLVLGLTAGILASLAVLGLRYGQDKPAQTALVRFSVALSAAMVLIGLVDPVLHWTFAWDLHNIPTVNPIHGYLQLSQILIAFLSLAALVRYGRILAPVLGNRPARQLVPMAILLLIALGWFTAERRGISVDKMMRQQLLHQATGIAETLDLDQVKELTFTEADKGLAAFERIREQMIAHGRTLRQRSIYSMALREGQIFFGPENLAEDDPLASPPGTLYERPAPEDFLMYQNPKPIVAGPQADEYGIFISATVPIVDPDTQTVLMVIGLDAPADEWMAGIRSARRVPILGSMALSLILLAGGFCLRWRERLPVNARYSWRYIEAALIAVCGLAVTATASFLVSEVENREHWGIHRRLADSCAETVRVELNALKSDLDSVVRFFEDSRFVARGEFHHFVEPLVHNSGFRAIEWVPRVLPSEIESYREKARDDGLDRFSIFELDVQGNTIPAKPRADYFPVYYVEPLSENEPALGFDLASESSRRSALSIALRTGFVTATDPIVLVQETANHSNILIVQPIEDRSSFGSSDPPASSHSHRGLVVGVIDLQELLNRGLSSGVDFDAADLCFDIIDLMASQKPGLLASYPREHAEHPVDIIQSSPSGFDDFLSVYPLFFFGRSYGMIAHRSVFPGSYLVHTGWICGVAGLLFTAILTLFVVFLQNRHAELEGQVRQRTFDLQANLFRSQKQQRVVSQIAGCSDIADGNIERVWPRITEGLCDTLDISRTGIWLFNDDCSELRCIDLYERPAGVHSSGAVLRRNQFREEFAALETARYVDAHDALTDPRTAGYVEGYLRPLGIVSMLDAVVQVGGVNLGTLCVEHIGTPRRWHYDEIIFVCQLADQIALAILNQRRRHDERALQESTDYFNAIFQYVSAGILLIDPATGTIVDANPVVAGLCGTPVQDMRGKPCHQFVCPSEVGQCPITDLGLTVDRSERILLDRSGRRIPVIKSIQPIHIGGRDLLLESFVDIRNRKEAEESLRQSERRYRSIVEHINDALYIHDFNGILLDVNDNTCKLLGYSREELIGSHLSRFDGPENARMIPEHMKTLYDTGRLLFDGEHIRKDGTLVATCVSARVVSREGQGIVQSFLRDISERKRAEEALRIERQRLASIIEGTHVGTWEWNVQTGETILNERWAEIVGYRLEELAPTSFQTWLNLAHPDDLKVSDQQLHRHFAGELKVYDCECRMKHKNGSWVWIQDRGKVVEWTADGKPLRMSGTHTDITDRKQAEEKLHEAMEAARAANVAKSQFLANMSHEIRTPMNAILGFAELLAEDILTPPQSDHIQTIRNSGAHLLDLINDILDFSKIEAGKMTLEFIECSLETLLNEIEFLMAPFAQNKGLRFEMIKPTVVPKRIRTDAVRLRQCLVNLINNAIKFTETGHVIVRTLLLGTETLPVLRFEVEDTGPGIDPAAQNKIFEAFEQADGSMTRKYGGTGLGLAITRHLARLFGGSLQLTSQIGKGSTFILEIPVAPDRRKRPRQNRQDLPSSGKSSESSPHQFQGRILVAEDVKTNQALVEILLNQVGLQPVMVEDGQAAIEQVLRQEFDLILMDMQMPRLNGFEAARKLRKQGVHTPIVALTAGAIKGDEQKCLEAGCDEYLTKPIDRNTLYGVLAKYLPAATRLKHPV